LNIRSLHSGHVSLLEEMTNFGDEFMKTVHPEVTTPIKMGYHLAPFNTVSHLHMHILSGNWKGLKKVAFWNNTLWFISNKNAIKKSTIQRHINSYSLFESPNRGSSALSTFSLSTNL